MKTAEEIFLGLGTNLGNRIENLRNAKALLAPKVEILQESSIYQTPPWGYLDQPKFLNQVIEVRTKLQPYQLLRYLKAVETQMGRVTLFRYGPRIIDLDIIFYGDRVINRKKLQIPHPRMAERAFVLIPLCEIAPGFVHPVLGIQAKDLLKIIDTLGVERI